MGNMTKLNMGILTALRGAGGGGNESARQPIESPDSLRSIAYARIVDLVSEGEIVGFADQDNPLSCVFLNETPVANADGSLNFRNIQIDSRVGTQTQDYLPNFEGVENEIAVGVELRQGTAWTRAITNTNLNSIRLRLSTPALSKTNMSNGDITGHSVSYSIAIQTDGGAFVTKLNAAMTGKTSSKYERSHRIELPPATTGWNIRVTRTSPNADTSSIQDSTYIESYAEIIEAKLRMPMSALVSVIVDAEQFNAIPPRAYRLKGRIIRVPSNYDPDTRQYTGVWDGTFQSRYSNNPAWVFYDMALNTRYGLGHLVPNELVNKWVLYRIAQYCDQLVPDGFGGMEPRFTCNLVLQAQNDALRVMQDLATVFRGIIYANGGSITAVSDMPEDPVYTYTPANVLEGKFMYAGSARKVRHTVALVSWTDLSDFGRAKVEYVDDPEGIARYGIQQTEVIAVGCTSQGQARRWGRYLLATERYETDTVTFGVGLDGTVVAPGKIVNIADPLRAGERRGGRIRNATLNSVEVDFMSVSASAGDMLVATMPNGVTERRIIDSITDNTIVVTTNFSAIPVLQSVWAVDSVAIPLGRYRVLGVAERNDGESLGYSLTAVIHIPGKFAFADLGEPIESTPIPDAPGPVVPSPTGLTISQRDVSDDNTTAKIVNLSWTIVPVAVSYNVLWRQGQASWMDLGTVGYTNIDIPNVMPGPFEVQVIAVNSLGVRSLPTFAGPFDITPVSTPPGFVEVIQADISQEVIDRLNGDADVAAAAAADATVKANAARDAAIAHADVIGAQVADILEADEWNSTDTYPEGDLVQYAGKLYRALTENTNQQPDTNPDDWQFIGNYASLGEAVAASISMGTQNASDIDAVSTQLDVVVARMPAGSGELATSASVASEASARVAGDAAAASRLDVVEARMPAGSGQLATATALSALDARVTTAEGTLTTQASALTALQAGTNGRGVNIMPDHYSTFEATSLPAMTAPSGGTVTRDTTYKAITAGVRFAAPVNYALYFGGPMSIKLTPGKKYIVSYWLRSAMAGNGISPFIEAEGAACYYGADTTVTVANVMQRKSVIIDTSANTSVNAWFGFIKRGGNEDVTIDGIQIEELVGTTATPSAYSRGTTGTQTSANTTAITLLDARVTSAEGTLTAQSSQITTLTARMIGAPGVNRLRNPSFMSASTAGWTSSRPIAGQYSPRLGGYHLVADPAAGPHWIASDTSANGENSAVAGEVSTFAVTVNCDSANWYIAIQYRDAGGGLTMQTDSPMQPSTAGDWKRLSVTSGVAPAGTAYAVVVLYAPDTTTHFRIAQPMFQLGSFATPFTDNKSIQSQATAISTLDARVTAAEGTLTVQSSQITSLTASIAGKADASAVTALTARVTSVEGQGYGVNLLPNSTLATGSTLWTADNPNGWDVPQINHAGSDWVPQGMRNWGSHRNGVPTIGQYLNMKTPVAAVTEDRWFIGSVYMATHRGQAQVYIEWRDGNMNVLAYSGGPAIGDGDAGGGQSLTGWARRHVAGLAPAGARYACVLVQARGDGVNSEPYVWMLRPMLEEARAGQTSPSPWNAGGFEGFAAYTLRLDVNGYVTGWNFTNNGTQGNFDIVADNFRIVAPGGGARTEYSAGNWRVYDSAGTLRVRMGVW